MIAESLGLLKSLRARMWTPAVGIWVAVTIAMIGGAGAQGLREAERTSESTDVSMIVAAEKGDLEGIAKSMRSGGSIATRDDKGRNAVLAAAYGNHVAAALFLMAAGSDVNAKDAQGNSAFLIAAAEGYLDIVKLSLRSGADVNSTNRFGGTALIPAAHYGHVAVVKELLATKIPVDHVNNLGWTALLEAIILGDGGAKHTEIVRLLVGAKANVNLADKNGVTPLQHAKKKGYTEMVTILEAAGAK
jgi:ankyrin repeat protein